MQLKADAVVFEKNENSHGCSAQTFVMFFSFAQNYIF